MSWLRLTGLLLVALLAGVVGAQAGDREDCVSNDPDRRVRGCTNIIKAGKETAHNQAVSYNNRGNAYREKREYNRAIADFDQAIRLRPDGPDAYSSYFNRGQAYGQKGDYDRAIADYGQAIRLKPDLAAAYSSRGLTYAKKGDYDRAMADYDNAIRLKPDFAAAYFSRGGSYFQKGEYARAVADYDQAIRLEPDFAAYFGRGITYAEKGEYNRAIADYDKAIRLDPKSANAFHFRGRAYLSAGKYDEALADLSEAIKREPSNASALSDRGQVWLSKDDYDRALADFGAAVRLAPNLARAFVRRGIAHYGRGNIDRALDDFTEGVRLAPMDALGFIGRGDAWAKKKGYDRAIEDYDAALRLNPKQGSVRARRGLAWYEKGNYDRAISDFDAAIEMDGSNAGLLSARSFALQSRGQQGDLERALSDLRASLQPSPQGIISSPEQSEVAERVKFIEKELAAIKAGSKPAGRRIALVVGNSLYVHAPHLRNPANDAKSVAAAFRRLGFREVIELYDLDRQQFGKELKLFGDKAAQADWAVIFFSGHGIQVNGQSYLIPVDGKLSRASHVADEAIPVDRLLAKVAEARKLRLVIIDACRNNPFLARMANPGGTRSLGRGLARIEDTGGALVAYATRDGQIADDGSGEHSPFTQALVEHLEEPGLELDLFFRRVRDAVFSRTLGAQEPFTYGSIPSEELYFKAAGQ